MPVGSPWCEREAPSAIRLRAFPLGLLAPRCQGAGGCRADFGREPLYFGERLISHHLSRSGFPLGTLRLQLGRGPTLSPASGLLLVAVIGVFSAPFHSFIFGAISFVSGPSESALAQPLSGSASLSFSWRFRFLCECLRSRRRSSVRHGRS